MDVHVLTIGKDLYYVAESYEDAMYEKEYAEEENILGRKNGIKYHSVKLNMSNPEEEVRLGTWVGTVQDIIDLM